MESEFERSDLDRPDISNKLLTSILVARVSTISKVVVPAELGISVLNGSARESGE